MAGFYWLASYPKSGNTWFRAFLSNVRDTGPGPQAINQIATGDIASNREWLDDVLGFDTADLTTDEIDDFRPAVYRWTAADGATSYYKIHDARMIDGLDDPAYLAGTLYIVRNPLDVAPSYANQLNCSLDDAIRDMSNPNRAFCASPNGISQQVRQTLLSWSGHVASWIDTPNAPLHLLRYEDMQQAPLPTFTAAARFLGLPCDTATIESALAFSSFAELAAQEAHGGFRESLVTGRRFFRRGESGGWRDTLSVEQVRRIVADHQSMMARLGYLQDALSWLATHTVR